MITFFIRKKQYLILDDKTGILTIKDNKIMSPVSKGRPYLANVKFRFLKLKVLLILHVRQLLGHIHVATVGLESKEN